MSGSVITFSHFHGDWDLIIYVTGVHLGGAQTADLGDGNGEVDQLNEFREDFGNAGLGTCLESLIGGNHFRSVYRQRSPRAIHQPNGVTFAATGVRTEPQRTAVLSSLRELGYPVHFARSDSFNSRSVSQEEASRYLVSLNTRLIDTRNEIWTGP
jgi:hypothetical protein